MPVRVCTLHSVLDCAVRLFASLRADNHQVEAVFTVLHNIQPLF